MNNEEGKNNTGTEQEVEGSSTAGSQQGSQSIPVSLLPDIINAISSQLKRLVESEAVKIDEVSQDFEKKKAEIDKTTTGLEAKYLELNDKLKDFTNKTRTTIRRLSDEKLRVIELIGVFVVIFTFISVEVQILKYADDFFTLGGLSIIFISGMILFVLLLFLCTERWLRNDKEYHTPRSWWWLLAISVVLFICGICLGGIHEYISENSKIATKTLENRVNTLEKENEKLNSKETVLEDRMSQLEAKESTNIKSISPTPSSTRNQQTTSQ